MAVVGGLPALIQGAAAASRITCCLVGLLVGSSGQAIV